jgi:probable F420-dependent oxidoreductase
MREYVCALRAIWASWNDGVPLDFRGDFYSHTLMAPFFSPPPAPGGAPAVLVAAVGREMTKVAGEVADGMFAHAFTTERYLREVTLPTIEQGLHVSGRSRADFTLSHLLLVATGTDEHELAGATESIRRQIAFYASTPAYRGVLALHGWQALGDELVALSRSDRQDRWGAMVPLVDDEVLHAFAVVGEPERIGAEILRRFDGVVDRLSFYTTTPVPASTWGPVLSTLKDVVTLKDAVRAADPSPTRAPAHR